MLRCTRSRADTSRGVNSSRPAAESVVVVGTTGLHGNTELVCKIPGRRHLAGSRAIPHDVLELLPDPPPNPRGFLFAVFHGVILSRSEITAIINVASLHDYATLSYGHKQEARAL